mgnify:CR=1 FL=1
MESKWNPSLSRHKESSRRGGWLRLIPANGLRLIPMNERGLLGGAHRPKGIRSLSELRSFGRPSRFVCSGCMSGSGPLGVRRRRGDYGLCRADSQERKGME